MEKDGTEVMCRFVKVHTGLFLFIYMLRTINQVEFVHKSYWTKYCRYVYLILLHLPEQIYGPECRFRCIGSAYTDTYLAKM